jgi:hypothetical protein
MTEKFIAEYELPGSYAGFTCVVHFYISADDLEDDMEEAQLVEFYESSVQDHYSKNIHPNMGRVDEFIEWARIQLDNRTLTEVRNFVRAKKPNAECFFLPGRYEITDNITADDLGCGSDELSAWTDAAKQLGYVIE